MKSVLVVKLPHLVPKSVQAEKRSFSFLACAVVEKKYLFQPWHNHVIAQTVLYDLILERSGLYNAFLRFIHFELRIRRNAVRFIPDLGYKPMYTVQRSNVKPGRTLLVPFPALGSAECLIHITEIGYFLKIGHTARSLSVYPFRKGCAFFWCGAWISAVAYSIERSTSTGERRYRCCSSCCY